MRPLAWLGIGSAVFATVLIARRARGAPAAPFEPERIYGETERVRLSLPNGWRRVTSAEVQALPELRDEAVALRGSPGFSALPYGTLRTFVASNGITYALWIEQHYHEPEGPVKPWGYHRGVTVLTPS